MAVSTFLNVCIVILARANSLIKRSGQVRCSDRGIFITDPAMRFLEFKMQGFHAQQRAIQSDRYSIALFCARYTSLIECMLGIACVCIHIARGTRRMAALRNCVLALIMAELTLLLFDVSFNIYLSSMKQPQRWNSRAPRVLSALSRIIVTLNTFSESKSIDHAPIERSTEPSFTSKTQLPLSYPIYFASQPLLFTLAPAQDTAKQIDQFCILQRATDAHTCTQCMTQAVTEILDTEQWCRKSSHSTERIDVLTLIDAPSSSASESVGTFAWKTESIEQVALDLCQHENRENCPEAVMQVLSSSQQSLPLCSVKETLDESITFAAIEEADVLDTSIEFVPIAPTEDELDDSIQFVPIEDSKDSEDANDGAVNGIEVQAIGGEELDASIQFVPILYPDDESCLARGAVINTALVDALSDEELDASIDFTPITYLEPEAREIFDSEPFVPLLISTEKRIFALSILLAACYACWVSLLFYGAKRSRKSQGRVKTRSITDDLFAKRPTLPRCASAMSALVPNPSPRSPLASAWKASQSWIMSFRDPNSDSSPELLTQQCNRSAVTIQRLWRARCAAMPRQRHRSLSFSYVERHSATNLQTENVKKDSMASMYVNTEQIQRRRSSLMELSRGTNASTDKNISSAA